MGWSRAGNDMANAAEQALAKGANAEQAQDAAWIAGAHLTPEQLQDAKKSLEHDIAKYTRSN